MRSKVPFETAVIPVCPQGLLLATVASTYIAALQVRILAVAPVTSWVSSANSPCRTGYRHGRRSCRTWAYAYAARHRRARSMPMAHVHCIVLTSPPPPLRRLLPHISCGVPFVAVAPT